MTKFFSLGVLWISMMFNIFSLYSTGRSFLLGMKVHLSLENLGILSLKVLRTNVVQLIDELTNHFPAHGVFYALGIVYPQYWRQTNAEKNFRKHLDVIKKFYGEPKWIGEDNDKRLVPVLLDCFQLELQQHLFKLSMLSNSIAALEDPNMAVNPLTRLWRVIDANTSLSKEIPEYIKLAEIAMIHVLGSVEDERCFLSLAFSKDKLRNRLQGEHLSLVVGMHRQKVYTLEDFPYEKCFLQWINQTDSYQYGIMA